MVLLPYENEQGTTIKDVLRGASSVADEGARPIQHIAVIIGPEGGFSDEEALAVIAAGGISVSLGRTILRLIPATSGEVLYRGRDLGSLNAKELREMRQKLQMIFQDPYSCLNPRMNVLELVRAPLDVFGIGTRVERYEKVREMLEIVRPE